MNSSEVSRAEKDEFLATFGGERLTGSGFETETPDSDFAEAEASDESAGQ